MGSGQGKNRRIQAKNQAGAAPQSLAEMIAQRHTKLAEFHAGGQTPYPSNYEGRVLLENAKAIAAALEPGEENENAVFRLGGRVVARRKMGKILFLDLEDASGRMQLQVQEEDLPHLP